jgi:hypothetical protein
VPGYFGPDLFEVAPGRRVQWVGFQGGLELIDGASEISHLRQDDSQIIA